MLSNNNVSTDTRILLVFLLDKKARPPPKDMKLWVDALKWLKADARGGALGFFTYMELSAHIPLTSTTSVSFVSIAAIWLLSFHLWRPERLKWFVETICLAFTQVNSLFHLRILFIMMGWGVEWTEAKTKGKKKVE